MRKFFLTITIMLCAGLAMAQQVKVDSLSSYIKNCKADTVKVTVTDAKNADFETITEAVKNSQKPVQLTLYKNRFLAVIPQSAFANCDRLQYISIPEGVSLIEKMAFYGCAGLDSVTMSDDVTEIGCSAFNSCKKLKHIRISESLKEIQSGTFMDCGLEEVVIPKSVRQIGEASFIMCAQLYKVTILGPATLMSDPEIKESPFVNCDPHLVIYAQPDFVGKYRRQFPELEVKAF